MRILADMQPKIIQSICVFLRGLEQHVSPQERVQALKNDSLFAVTAAAVVLACGTVAASIAYA